MSPFCVCCGPLVPKLVQPH
uniref:Uncharacterized protein n=1 Tax=Arundo donax TaxID=35708 RepID=A0A0A9ES76_ARUDO